MGMGLVASQQCGPTIGTCVQKTSGTCSYATRSCKESQVGQELIVSNYRLLNASSDGDLQGIQEALMAGADLETRRPLVVKVRRHEQDKETEQKSKRLAGSRRSGMTPLMKAA